MKPLWFLESGILVAVLAVCAFAVTPPQRVWVEKTEEKRLDVNLASHLVRDAFRKQFDVAVLITNDSDLAEPVRIVSQELHMPIGILNPHQHHSKERRILRFRWRCSGSFSLRKAMQVYGQVALPNYLHEGRVPLQLFALAFAPLRRVPPANCQKAVNRKGESSACRFSN